MSIFASVTRQGTARAEDAFCQSHLPKDGKARIDCTGNLELRCQICGYPESI